MIGKYDEKRLTPQLAQALAATKAAEAGADPEKRAAGQRRSRVFVAAFMIVLGSGDDLCGCDEPGHQPSDLSAGRGRSDPREHLYDPDAARGRLGHGKALGPDAAEKPERDRDVAEGDGPTCATTA